MTTAIDLFAGAGGFTEGATRAGLDVVYAANHWQAAVELHEKNHPDVKHACQDLRQLDFRTLPDFDVLLASPACQGHSSASQPRRSEKHVADRNTAWAVVECAEVKRPERILVENVPAFGRWIQFDNWLACLRTLGYTTTAGVVDSADLGVPQNRRRLLVAAVLDGGAVDLDVHEPARHVPFADVMEHDVGGWAPVASKRPGVRARVADARSRLGRTFITQHTTNHRGRGLDRPLGTVTCASGHWNLVRDDEMRTLTPRELARCQSFPESWALPSSSSLATRLIGNAIPPTLAQWAAERLMAA